MKIFFIYQLSILFSLFFLINENIVFAQNHTIDSLKKELQKAKEDTSAINIINSLASELVISGHYDSAMKYANEAGKAAEKINYKRGIAKAFNVKGVVYDYQGNFPEALKNYFQALKIREEIGDQEGIIDTYNNIGAIYIYQGNNAEALKNLLSALKFSGSIESTKRNKRRIANIYVNVGLVYVHQLNYSEALKNYSEALKISKDVGDAPNTARCHLNIGNIYYNQGDYNSALENYLLALKIYEEMGNKGETALSQINIGIVLTKQKKYNEARKYLMNALQKSREIGAKDYIKACYNHLAELSEATGSYKDAYEYLTLYSELKDSLLNENNSKQMAEMKTKYETEKKDKEIILLNKDKEIQSVKITNQKATIKYFIIGLALLILLAAISFRQYNQKRKARFLQQVSETKMKALRAQMNPHFIYNSMNSVYHYMQENDFKSAGAYLISFSKLIRLILENSLYDEVSLSDELQALELFLSLESTRLEKKFIYEIKVAADIDKDKTLIPPLLLEPFVENSIWHGFKDKAGQGKIMVSVVKDGEMMKCIIEDNGVGRKEESEKMGKWESEKKTSVGMKLTEERISTINQIVNSKAQVTITDLFDEKNYPAGVKVELSLPLRLND